MDISNEVWGWVVCGSLLIAFTSYAGVVFSFNEVMIPLSKEFSSQMSLLGLLGALPSSVSMLLTPLATWFYYKIGTRPSCMIGVIIVSICLAFTSIVHSVALLYIFYGIGMGIGFAMVMNPPMYLLDQYFPYTHKRHVMATSIVVCSLPIGTIIFNPLCYFLLSHYGWRRTYQIYAAVLLTLGILTSSTYKTPSVDIKSTEVTTETNNKNGYKEIEEPTNHVIQLRTKIFIGGVWFLASYFKGIAYTIPLLTMVKQMDFHGISEKDSSQAMIALGISELVSRLVTSYVGDYIKGRILLMYVGCCLILAIQYCFAILAKSYIHMVLLCIGLGMFDGPIIAAMFGSCAEVLQGQYVPEIFSVFRVGFGFGIMSGLFVAGLFFDGKEPLTKLYTFTTLIYMAAATMYGAVIVLNKYKPSIIYPQIQKDETTALR